MSDPQYIAANPADQEDLDSWAENERDFSVDQKYLDAGYCAYGYEKLMLADGSELTMRRILFTKSGFKHLNRVFQARERAEGGA